MRSNYIRPLKFDYVDSNEQLYKISDIPVKFIEEKDDYQKRKTKAETIIDQAQPQEQPFEELHNQQASPEINHQVAEQTIIKSHQPSNSQSLFGCCQSGIQEGEICAKCAQNLCKNCINRPQNIKYCTKCLQKLCSNCKKALKITFPDYKLRNYAINIKNYSSLHFSDCTCKNCSTGK